MKPRRISRKSRAGRSGPAPSKVAASPTVSVVIPAVNERRTIGGVIRQAFRVHPNTEVIVVANGSTDGTKELAAKLGARVIPYDRPLGHDVGRSVGARHARGSIVLFTDADIVIPAGKMKPFVEAVGAGVDVALNEYSGPTSKRRVHSVVLAKHALNTALMRSDLGGASMTTIPHALSRSALERIGFEALAVPPLAQAMGVAKGLTVKAVHPIDVGRLNPIRRRRSRGKDPLEDLIVGDHIEAMHWLAEATNERANYPDLIRQRDLVK